MGNFDVKGRIHHHQLSLCLWSVIAAVIAGTSAHAQTVTTVTGTQTGKISLTGSDSLTVTSGSTLSTGNDKAVSIKAPTAVSITVESGGSIVSEDDAITTKTIDTSVGTISITNNGTITSTVSGQAIDLDDVSAPGVTTTITNGATGSIIALDADGVRPGANATVINSGLIRADGPAGESHDGVDFQSYGGTVINLAGGLISGQRHGITSDLNVNVTNYGTIIGRNGSGVGSDGTGTVLNYGTIIGAYDGSGTGDGDGVDIDGDFYIDNYGTIAGQGAAGYGKDGDLNVSEGVALTGNGTLINEKGATITSVDIGATICCDVTATVTNNGTIFGTNIGLRVDGAAQIVNTGLISSDHIAFNFWGDLSSSLVNSGTIAGGDYGVVSNYATNGILNLDNYGIISGGTAAVYVGEGARINLTQETGSVINGDIALGGILNLIVPGTSQLAGVISGAGQLIKSGAGTLNLSGSNSYSGATTISAGTLQAGAANAFSASSIVTLASGGSLDANGFNQSLAGLVNAGTIATNAAATSTGTTLTVQGDYVGQGGKLVLNTNLAASQADRLVVAGNVSGTTTLVINNAGGKGGHLTGDGLELVQVGGTSQTGAISLASTLTLGAFDYNIFRGTAADPGNQNWYLRSAGYSAAAQSVLPYASSLLTLADATLGTLGSRSDNRANAGWWARVVGQYGSADPQSGAAYDAGVSYDQGMDFFQTGFEGTVARGQAGSLNLGLYGTAGRSRVDIGLTPDPVSGVSRGKARITTDVYGLGGSVTYARAQGFYIDLVGQANVYRSRLTAAGSQRNHGWSGTASVEMGQTVPLSQGWSIMPLIQASWTHLDLNSFVDSSGNAISFDETSAVKGRAGLRLNRQAEWSDVSGHMRSFTFHATGNMRRDFTQGTVVNVADTALDQKQKRLWVEGGLGATYVWNRKLSLFTETAYSRAVTGGRNNSFRPSLGLQALW